MLNSAWKPSGPAAMLVGTSGWMCFSGGLGDFLGFLLNKRLIFVIGVEKRTKVMDARYYTKPGRLTLPLVDAAVNRMQTAAGYCANKFMAEQNFQESLEPGRRSVE